MQYAQKLGINLLLTFLASSTIVLATLVKATYPITIQQSGIHKDKETLYTLHLSKQSTLNHTLTTHHNKHAPKALSCNSHLQPHHPNYFFHDFTPTPIIVPIYKPLLTHIGIKINWFSLIRQQFDKTHQTYQSGIDLQFYNALLLSLDIGYGNYQSKNLVPNYIQYPSKGYYSITTLSYLITSTSLANIYIGGGYGQSKYTVMQHPIHKPIANKYTTHFLKIIFGSEVVLISKINLYGGSLFGLAYQLHNHKNSQQFYIIPGYGTVKSPINLTLNLYLKWNITFLEKKIMP